jgi:hypothetical protein
MRRNLTLYRVRVFLVLGGTQISQPQHDSQTADSVRNPREDFWREFRISVIQEHVLRPKKVEGRPTYGPAGKGMSGAEVWLEFDAGELVPRRARVEVIAPEGNTSVADFLLDELE